MYSRAQFYGFIDELEKIGMAEGHPYSDVEMAWILKEAGLMSTMGNFMAHRGAPAIGNAAKAVGRGVAREAGYMGTTLRRGGQALAQGAQGVGEAVRNAGQAVRREGQQLGYHIGTSMANPMPINPAMPIPGYRETLRGTGHYLADRLHGLKGHTLGEAADAALYVGSNPLAHAPVRDAIAHPLAHTISHGLESMGGMGAVAGPAIGRLVGEAGGYLGAAGIGGLIRKAAPAVSSSAQNFLHAAVG